MPIRRLVRALASLGILALAAPSLAQNDPPAAPVITQPQADGEIVNPADVHMETGPFSDPDSGDGHLCTDWEIWTVTPSERVWFTACIGGVERVHTHLGDGAFVNSHAGRSELLPETGYALRVRHRDDSGQSNDWSPWSERLFETGTASTVFPLELSDVDDAPAPQWNDTTGVPLVLPAGSPPGSLVLEDPGGELLLELRGLDGSGNEVINPPALSEHSHPRLVMRAGSAPLSVPESDLTFTDELGESVTVYLPAAGLAPAEVAVFWISSNGSTYVGDLSQEEPDFAELARGAPVPWAVAQPGFKVEVVATGFQLPVNIAFVPDSGLRHDGPLFYVTELYGTIKVVMHDGTVGDYATDLLNFNPTGNFPGSGEQGLTGITVDPLNGDVYAAMLYSTNPDDDNAPHYPKVVRFTSLDGGRTADRATTILNMVGETQGQSHQISNLSFGPDGRLYVHMGDGFDAARAQDLNSYRGKILRTDRIGTALPDNPFYDAGDGINARDYIYAYGVRNPFGGAWRGADGSHYFVENGPSVDRFAKMVRGRNYGWNGSDQSMRIFALYNWDPAHAPVNIAFIEPAVFGGSGFPEERYGRAYVTESGPTWASGPQSRGKRVTEWILDGDGNLIEGERDVVVYNGSGKASAVALAAGPDGLYFSDLYKDQDYDSPIDRGANILRIRYVGTADFVADVRAGDRPLTVRFTDLSDVPGATEWDWSFGDGGTSTDRNPVHTYAQDGIYTVRLVVRGPAGTSIEQKNGYIKVGQFPAVAMIGGSLPPSASDQAVADFLSAAGYEVTSFDDDRGSRPTASEIADQFDCVVLSSTILSANIGGDFRDEEVPVLFWENALLQADREPLASDHSVVGGVQAIDVLDNTHPITEGIDLGEVTVFASPASMSVGRGTIPPGADVLATRAGGPGDAAIIAAEAGAELLGGHIAPDRRVFLFFEDASWVTSTAAGRTILEQAVRWVTGFAGSCAGDFNSDGTVDTRDVLDFLNAWAADDPAADFNGDGEVDTRDVLAFLNAWSAGC